MFVNSGHYYLKEPPKKNAKFQKYYISRILEHEKSRTEGFLFYTKHFEKTYFEQTVFKKQMFGFLVVIVQIVLQNKVCIFT